ncbi:MAG TPA: YqeG family HAD IIIA-type phosphatase [Candidatus Enterenecus stercoripullorum]|nr:YqeG family HAD IIIA-type phosphatase [Candidatus Enterenecus stercoripullorum]
MALFRAGFLADDIYQITGQALKRRGIRLLLADLDNTLVPYGVPLPDEKLKAWRDELAAHGVSLFILSNNRHESRPRTFAQELDVPYIGHAGKPKTASFYAAMERMGVAPEQTALVGDQIFTDVMGGNRAGVATILVKPIRLAGNPGRYLRYAVEVPLRLLSHGGEKL